MYKLEPRVAELYVWTIKRIKSIDYIVVYVLKSLFQNDSIENKYICTHVFFFQNHFSLHQLWWADAQLIVYMQVWL